MDVDAARVGFGYRLSEGLEYSPHVNSQAHDSLVETDVQEQPAALAARIGQGDRQAEEALVGRYSRGLMLMLKRRTGDMQQAEELHQEAFQIVIERLRSKPLEDPAKLAGFIHKVGVNLYIDQTRKVIRQKTDVNHEAVLAAPDQDAGQLHQLIQNEAASAVRKLVEELKTPRDREILRRFYILDQDKSAVCQALDLDSVHFDRVISRARKRFRALIVARAELTDSLGAQA